MFTDDYMTLYVTRTCEAKLLCSHVRTGTGTAAVTSVPRRETTTPTGTQPPGGYV